MKIKKPTVLSSNGSLAEPGRSAHFLLFHLKKLHFVHFSELNFVMPREPKSLGMKILWIWTFGTAISNLSSYPFSPSIILNTHYLIVFIWFIFFCDSSSYERDARKNKGNKNTHERRTTTTTTARCHYHCLVFGGYTESPIIWPCYFRQ